MLESTNESRRDTFWIAHTPTPTNAPPYMYDWTKMCNMLICHAMLKLKAFSLSILVGFLYTKALSICICMRFVMLYLFCICLSTLGSSMERFFFSYLMFLWCIYVIAVTLFPSFPNINIKANKKKLTPEIFLWHVVPINMSNKLLVKPMKRNSWSDALQWNKMQIEELELLVPFPSFSPICQVFNGKEKKIYIWESQFETGLNRHMHGIPCIGGKGASETKCLKWKVKMNEQPS